MIYSTRFRKIKLIGFVMFQLKTFAFFLIANQELRMINMSILICHKF